MFRNYDWQCSKCDSVKEFLVEFPQGDKPPKVIIEQCAPCQKETKMTRCLVLPSKYMGETVVNPMVAGGRFDTVGQRKLPDLPQMPEGLNASGKKDFFNSKEFQSAKKRRESVKKQNKAKQKRADLIRKGANINMRNDKLPGDPNVLI